MVVTITLKDPDGFYESFKNHGLDIDDLTAQQQAALNKFVRYKEYLVIELDLANGTARIVPVKD